MTKAHKRRGLGVVLTLAAAGSLALFTPTVAASAAPKVDVPTTLPCNISASQVMSGARSIHIGGVVVAQGTSSTCEDPPPPPEPAFNGTPPLLFNGRQGAADCDSAPFCDDGNIMDTRQTGPVTLVPIFWAPPGYSFAASYESLIDQYLSDVAAASGQFTNVFSVLTEYSGNNGSIQNRFRAGTPINASDPLPASGCTVLAPDTTGIYNDGTGYTACLDMANLEAEVNSITASMGLPHSLSYMYELFLPKHIEGCFFPGTDGAGNICTINNEPSAAYCAFHGTDAAGAVYSSMNFPIYGSPTGFTCGTEARFPVEESPNNNPDADTEISPLSHETSEAVTDPDTQTGWYDSTGNEIGDDCAYIFGATGGTAGHLYNQTINGHHYITQEEFSNRFFFRTNGKQGCVQSWEGEFPF